MADERLTAARDLYEKAVFFTDTEALTAANNQLDEVEADLALARGRLLHARFLADRAEDPNELVQFERAATLYGRLGNTRGEAEACFWIGAFHQVVRQDGDAALPWLRKAYELAERANDPLTLSYAARHLGFHAMEAGDLTTARELLEESLQLRRKLDFRPGVAAALLALADVTSRVGEKEKARELLAEAEAEATASGAKGVLSWIEQARADFS
jgi:tetratricopeptide (TPR) repeat protein